MAAVVERGDIRTRDSRPVQRLVGRAAELDELQALLNGGRQGSGRAAVVRGDAGIGKSAVLLSAVESTTGMHVLRCAGVEAETELAYAGLHQLVWPLADRIDALPGVQAAALRSAMGRGDSSSDRLLVGMALLTLLSDAAKEMPLLLLIEDAPWLDALSAEALVFVARRLETESIAMFFESRTGGVRDFSAPGLSELTLTPLGQEAAAELLDTLDDEVAPLVKQRLITESEGNPLALIELCRSLSSDERRGRDRLPLQLPLSAQLQQLYLERLRSLPEVAQRIALIAAAETSGDTSIVLAAAGELDISIDAFAPAEEARLIVVDGQKIRFCHSLERSAIYGAASFGERVAAHRALAAVLPDDDRRAWHLAAATFGPDEELAAALDRSADQAQARRGPAVAAAAWERAAELSGSDTNRARRLARAARSALDAGHFNRAQALLVDAERVKPEREVQADIDLARGLAQYQTSALEDAPATLIRGASDVAKRAPERAALMLATAARMSWLADDEGRLDEVWKSITALDLAGDEPMTVLAMSFAGPTMHRNVELPGGIFQASLALSEHTPPSFWMWPPAGAANMAGELVTAQRIYRKLVVSLSTGGVIGQLTSAWTSLALVELWLGRWTDAAMHASEALRLREMGDVASTGWALVVLSRIAGAQGRADECRALAAEAVRLATDQGALSIMSAAAYSVASLEMSLGRNEEAFAHFATAARPEDWPAGRLSGANWAADLVDVCIRTERLEIANHVVEAMERWIEGQAPSWAHVAAHRGRALLSTGDRAAAEFEAAVSISSENNHAFEMAEARLQYGEWLRRQRFKTEARRQLRVALEMFSEMGAQPWVERAKAELRATGVSLASRSAASIDQLTPQEMHIAQLGAQGMSNRDIGSKLFLSPRTVGFHLSNVFGKLGIASRTELRGIKLQAHSAE
jgi:DNA-binding CsgD family transcriptional regulator